MPRLVALPILFATLAGSAGAAPTEAASAEDQPLPAWGAASTWETDPEKLCRGLNERAEDGQPVSEEQVDACAAEAAQRLAQRRELALTRPIADLEEVPEEYLIAEERQRLDAVHAERVAARAVADTRKTDPKWVGPALSAAFCAYAEMKRHALVTRKRRPSDAHDLDGRAHDYDRSMHTIQLAAKSAHAKLLACSQPLILKIEECLRPDAACAVEARDYVSLVPRIFP
jgi:hypothetical protein